MNKIPFTSQNPYAFYAKKTIDSYDTETNTRKGGKKKKEKGNKSLLKRRPFFFSCLKMGNTCLGNIQFS